MIDLPPFPASRPRRLRKDAFSRALVQEHRLHASDLILPAFVVEGERVRQDGQVTTVGGSCVGTGTSRQEGLHQPSVSLGWNAHPRGCPRRSTRCIALVVTPV